MHITPKQDHYCITHHNLTNQVTVIYISLHNPVWSWILMIWWHLWHISRDTYTNSNDATMKSKTRAGFRASTYLTHSRVVQSYSVNNQLRISTASMRRVMVRSNKVTAITYLLHSQGVATLMHTVVPNTAMTEVLTGHFLWLFYTTKEPRVALTYNYILPNRCTLIVYT